MALTKCNACGNQVSDTETKCPKCGAPVSVSKELVLSSTESKSFAEALIYAKQWCSENQWAVGLGEMALGAGLVAWGVHNGAIEMGTQLVGTELGGGVTEFGGIASENIEAVAGTVAGSTVGATAGSILGSVGIAAMGGAIGIPAALVIGGAAAVFGMAGYIAGDVVHDVTAHLDVGSLVGHGSVLLVGVALIIDGARRCLKDEKVLSKLSAFSKKVIKLNDLSVKIIAKSMKDLQGFIDEFKKLPKETIDITASTSGAAIGAGIGASAGSAAAAGSVTIIGSQALGGMAVSLGIVSAPVWPIIAGVGVGAGVGYAAYKAIKYWGSKPETENS